MVEENSEGTNHPGVRAQEQSEHDAITPDFSVGSDDKAGKDDATQQAKDVLGAEEKAAADNTPKETTDDLAGTKQAEEDDDGLYSGVGKTFDNIEKKVKNKVATGVIFVILAITGGFFGLQAFQPFSLVAQFVEHFNSMQVSADVRSRRFFDAQMSNGRTKNPIRGSAIFGRHFKISEKQNERLKAQGIEYDDTTFKDANGKTIKVLKYDDGSGEIKVVAVDQKTAKKLNEIGLEKYNTDTVKYNTEAVDFVKIYAEDNGFFKSYNKGSMTWRGAIVNWFGTNTARFLKNNKLTRNMWEKWEEKRAELEAKGGDPVEAAKDTMEKGAEEIKEGDTRVVEDEKEENEDGEKKLKKPESEEPETIKRSEMTHSKVRTKLDKIAGKFNKAANIGCAVMGVMGSINLLVQAWETMQILQITTGYLEAVDKTKAGLGEDSPINELAAALNEKKRNTNYIFEPTGVSGVSEDRIGETVTAKKVYTEKTAMESEGIAALYDNGVVNPNDPSVASFNLMASSKQILGGISLSVTAFKGCLIAKAGVAAVSAVADGLEIAGCIAGLVGAAFTFGATAATCAPFVTHQLAGMALSAGIAATLGALVSVIAPAVANMMTRDLISDLGGEDLGNALAFGANKYIAGVHVANGGSWATADKYREFAVEQQQVIAENARYERAELSPFDVTSKNTFLGTILTQLMNYTHTNTLMSTVTASNSVVSSAMVSIMEPSAMAYDIAATLPSEEEYAETCPYTASVGAVGDASCDGYSVTDISTSDDDPADVIDKNYELGGIDESSDDETLIIKEGSRLAKYILYCDNRTSPLGVADYNIASEVGDFGTVESNAANGTIGAIPVVGDVIEIIDDKQQLNNIGFISGESCVAGNTVEAAESPNWDEAKYYQRFIEDQSLAESMGLIEKSAVTAYLEDYYKEHPLDNSYEGMLARYSGLDKDTVVALLDVIEYYNFVANYDASDRYAFGESVEVETEINYDNENVLAGGVTLIDNIVYADVRNRVFVV